MSLSSIFGGGSPSQQKTIAASTSSQSEVTEQLKSRISQELAIANATELVNKLTENCFNSCQKAPYNMQDNDCIDKCLAKYMRSWNVVSQAYVKRIKQASENGGI